MSFELDTSGVVSIPSGPYAGDWTWEKLPTDFLRGYVRPALEGFCKPAQRKFKDVEHLAFLRDGVSEYVGCGSIEIVIARAKFDPGSIRKGQDAPATYLQYRLKGRRISRDKACDLFLAWNNARAVIETSKRPGFRHLAPATLAAMMKDCAALHYVVAGCVMGGDLARGAVAWNWRQTVEGHPASPLRALHDRYPPLTLSLGDDGLIYAAEAELN